MTKDVPLIPNVTQFEVQDRLKVWETLKAFLQRGSNRGTVKTLFPDSGSNYTKFSLEGGQTAVFSLAPEPRDHDYYYLDGARPNYDALVGLLYLAAEHKWEIQARATGKIETTLSSNLAQVSYLVVEF